MVLKVYISTRSFLCRSPTACAQRIDLSESHQYESIEIPTQRDEVIEVADVHEEVPCSPCEAYSVQAFNGITESEDYEVVRST